MNPEAQRIVIAEACGIITKDQWGPLYRTQQGMVRDCPDYLNDLNAMSAAEDTLSVREKQNYISTLRNICVVAGCWPETATADQRAEAFLHTLGKWKEGA